MLHPNLTVDTGKSDEFNFVGTNRILLQVQQNTNQIVLHSNKLEIHTVNVTSTDGEPIVLVFTHIFLYTLII